MASLIKESFEAWQKDRAPQMAAGIAFYAIFSVAPLLLILIAIAGVFFAHGTAEQTLIGYTAAYVGQNAANGVAALIRVGQSQQSGSFMLIGIIAMLFGATGFLLSLQDAFNVIWHVETKKTENTIWMIAFKRIVSVGYILVMGILFIALLIASVVFTAFVQYLTSQVPALLGLLPILNFVVSFIIAMLLFAVLFKFLPDVRIGWNDVWVGAAVTSLLFTTGKNLLGWYLGSSSMATAYGAAGSIVILLLWIYYSAQVLFFGVEMTKIYAQQRHLEVLPRRYAQFAEEERAKRKISFLPDLATIMGFLLIEFQVAKWFLSFRKKWKVGRRLLRR